MPRHHALLYWKCMKMLKSHNSYINRKIKMAGLMINYPSWPIILPNMECTRPTTSEKLHSQSEAWRTSRQTEKLNAHILSYAGQKSNISITAVTLSLQKDIFQLHQWSYQLMEDILTWSLYQLNYHYFYVYWFPGH